MDLHSTAAGGVTVAQTISTALSTLKTARELAKDSKDRALKDVINEALDNLLDLKERMLALDEDNRELKKQLAAKASITGPVAPHGYIFKDGDAQHPFCPRCFQEKGHEYPLVPENYGATGLRRVCSNCKWVCIERYPGYQSPS